MLTNVLFDAHVIGYAPGDIVELDIKTDGLRKALVGLYAFETVADPNREPTEEHAIMKAMQAALAPIRAVKSDASITVTGAGVGTWVDTDATGTIAARLLDLVVEDVEVGDWVYINTEYFTPSDPDAFSLDYFPVVDGAYSGNHTWSHVAAASGPASLLMPGNLAWTISSFVRYQVQANDIDSQGNLRMRLRHNGAAAATRQIFCISGFALHMEMTGPFGPRPSS